MGRKRIIKDKNLEKKFISWERGHFGRLDSLQKNLRDKVLLIHELIEIKLDTLLTRSTYSDVLGQLKGERKDVFESQVIFLLNTADFMRKLSFAQDQQLLPPRAKEKLRYVNDIRNWFSHSKAYFFQLQSFSEYPNYLEAIKKIAEAKELMDKILEEYNVGTSVISDKKIKQRGKNKGLFIDLVNKNNTREISITIKGRNKFEISEIAYKIN